MAATVFNPLQIHLLRMFALDKRESGLEELKNVLYRHYSKRMEERLDALWESGALDQKRLESLTVALLSTAQYISSVFHNKIFKLLLTGVREKWLTMLRIMHIPPVRTPPKI